MALSTGWSKLRRATPTAPRERGPYHLGGPTIWERGPYHLKGNPPYAADFFSPCKIGLKDFSAKRPILSSFDQSRADTVLPALHALIATSSLKDG